MTRVRSGSCEPPSSVDPTRSANRIVATFRSSAGSVTGSMGAAHEGQNLAPDGSAVPQCAQAATRGFSRYLARPHNAPPRSSRSRAISRPGAIGLSIDPAKEGVGEGLFDATPGDVRTGRLVEQLGSG